MHLLTNNWKTSSNRTIINQKRQTPKINRIIIHPSENLKATKLANYNPLIILSRNAYTREPFKFLAPRMVARSVDFLSRPREPSFHNVAPSFRGELFLEIEEKHVRAVRKLRESLVWLSTTEVNPYEWFRRCVHGSPVSR